MGDTTMLSTAYAPTGRFDGDPYLVSLRGKDPKKTSTVTMHVPLPADGGRVPGVRSHHFGPGLKVTGGRLGYVQEDRTEGRVRVPRSLDPEEILSLYRTQQADAAKDKVAAAAAAASGLGMTGGSGGGDVPGGSAAARSRGMQSSDHQHTGVFKMVYTDARESHVIDRPVDADVGVKGSWSPPHLDQSDLKPGPLLGVREVPGSDGTKLVASKHRLMPEKGADLGASLPGTNLARAPPPGGPHRPPYSATDGPWGLAPYAPLQQTSSFGAGGDLDEATLRAYGGTKLVGHREYEAAAREMDGLQPWRETGLAAVTAARHEHGWTSTRVVAPKEHMEAHMSLRRG
uniref:Uncharacterized protein n=1 Tax=Chlamydomonas euryale TaxID=1486919 RepID=A0A7R9W1P1_9CHLO|mmetsp:Transcript_9728/g.29480  ORF Transcript_9728/g.29480 Transcript_9728/m.29480 type:complete len:344 (+) Transcript_9728:222-1253(+)